MITKTSVVFVLVFCCSLALFVLGFQGLEAGIGYFGDGLSSYAQGDTLMYVYFASNAPADESTGEVKFRISLDGGSSWNEYFVLNHEMHSVRPTLTVIGDTLLVNIGYLYESTNLGQSWGQVEYFPFYPGITESRPYVFYRNGCLTEFRLSQAYPEWKQYDFTMDATEDILLKPYYYFTNENSSPNGHNLYWSGYDVTDGIIRTNSDLWIKQSGGGNNNGWPTFLSPVIVQGNVLAEPCNYPLDDVFQGGLIEDQDMGGFPSINPAREDGIQIGESTGNEQIFLIEVDGSTYSGWHGVFSQEYRVNAIVYDEYPPVGDSLFTNNFSLRDTLWTALAGGPCSDREFFVDGELWIKGEFSCKQSWTASGDIKIIGDITLSGTIPGEDPIDNNSDFVNLLSEKKIELKYGYKNPADSMRIHPMCGPDSEPHYIYANLYAIGNGQGNSFEDGVFSFEYQHPHPSTPALEVTIQQPDGSIELQLYDWIDLHRRHYPSSTSNPWPSPELGQQRLDLPWYNPLWPEAQPYLERGVISFWGNIYQRRRGFLHRSHNDSEYPSTSGIWDINFDMCGYPTNPVNIVDPVFGNIGLCSQNYPGAAGSGVGYKKEYHVDHRTDFYRAADDFYTRFWRHGIQINSYDDYTYQSYNIGCAPYNEATQTKSMDARDGFFAYAANDVLLFDDGVSTMINLSALTKDQGLILNLQLNEEHHPVMHQYRKLDSGEALTVITEIDPSDPPQIISSESYPSSVQRMPEAFCLTPNDRRILARFEQGMISINEIMADGTLDEISTWDISETLYTNGRLSMKAANESTIDLFYWENLSTLEYNGWGKIRHHRVQLPVANSDATAPPLSLAMLNAYPNPADGLVNIYMKIPAHRQHSVAIFNIRGQKIREYKALGAKFESEYNIDWDVRDERKKRVSSGIYILRLKIDNQEMLSKRITIQ